MSLDGLWLVECSFYFLFRSSQLLDQSHRLPLQPSLHSPTSSSVNIAHSSSLDKSNNFSNSRPLKVNFLNCLFFLIAATASALPPSGPH